MPLSHGVPPLQVENLKKHCSAKSEMFSRSSGEIRAVDEVSSSLYKGETLGLVGESGCGKSTLGHQIVGLERPIGGRALYQGKDLANISAGQVQSIRTQPQMVFQDSYSSLSPRKYIYEVLSRPMLYHGLAGKNTIHRRVERPLGIVGPPQNVLGRYSHKFSGGQRRRIGIAKAPSLKPQLLVCDEPVNVLDVSVQAQILSLPKELQQELNPTRIFIGHELDTVNYVSDRIIAMYLKQIVELMGSQELFEHLQHPCSKALFDAVPLADPRARKRRGKGTTGGEAESETGPADGCPFYPRCPRRTEECTDTDMVLQSTPVESRYLISCTHTIRGGGRVIQGGVS